MDVKNDISEELRSLSALVATIGRETPYRAPEGYFVSFPELVLERLGTSSISHVLPEASKPLMFSVPEGYFEGFAQQVLNRIKSGSGPSKGLEASMGLEEEELPAILARAARITPYKVPEGYFDGLAPILAVLKDKGPYVVPVGYFDRLADEIAAKTAAGALSYSNDRLEAAREERGRTARVIGLGKPMRWMKYAAAAVVAGLIVTVGWLRWHPATPGAPALASAQSAHQALEPGHPPMDLAKISDAELQNFLVDQDTTLAQPVGNNPLMATVDMDDSNLKSLLGDVSDGELKQYLDDHGGPSDIAAN